MPVEGPEGALVNLLGVSKDDPAARGICGMLGGAPEVEEIEPSTFWHFRAKGLCLGFDREGRLEVLYLYPRASPEVLDGKYEPGPWIELWGLQPLQPREKVRAKLGTPARSKPALDHYDYPEYTLICEHDHATGSLLRVQVVRADATPGRPRALPEADRAAIAACLTAYEKLLGKPARTWEAAAGEGPPVVVCHFPPQDKRAWHTLLTAGMSGRRMTLPPDTRPDLARVELALYVSEVKEAYVEHLQWLAAYPFIDKTWLSAGHTVQWPLGPLFPGSKLRHFFFLRSPAKPDKDLKGHLARDGDPANLLWVVPITQEELVYKRKRGADGLVEALKKGQLEVVLDEGRKSCV